MRIIIQPVTDGFELCARLGLVFAPLKDLSGKAIYAVLRGSPSAKAGLKARDIVFAADKTRLDSIQHLVFSDRRPSELNLRVFVARYFTVASIAVRVCPEPYRSIEDIVTEASRLVAARPATPIVYTYARPPFEFAGFTMARPSRKRRRA